MEFDINSKYFIMRQYGGYSPCIEGNNEYKLRPFRGSVLPNCSGWAVGRFNQLLNLNTCKWLGSWNARDMLKNAKAQGLKTGTAPVIGGLLVWDTDFKGHCSVIENIENDSEVITSESGWRYTAGPIVRTITRKRTGQAWEYPGGKFLGIVYPPTEADTMKTFYAYTGGEALKDPEVLRLQILLNGLQGSRLTKDSYYGPATTKAVIKWQQDHNIKATGNCDSKTWDSILGRA